MIEHKRHVLEAVESLQADKEGGGKSRRKKLYRRERVQDIEEDLTSPPGIGSGGLDGQYAMMDAGGSGSIRPSDHIPFTAEPHPLVTSEDIGLSRGCGLNGRLGSVVSRGGARERGMQEQDEREYFRELTEVDKRHQHHTHSVST